MNSDQMKILSVGAGFLIMFLSGFSLAGTGKPYGTLVFTIHKLIGVGLGILLFVTIRQIQRATPLSPSEIAAVVVTVLFFTATVTTGSLLSIPISKPIPDIVSKLNKVLPYFTVLSTAGTLYFLNRV